MTGRRPNIYWKACWLVISPVMLFVVLIAYVILQAQNRPTYPSWNPAYELFPQTKTLQYPDWVFAIIILLCAVPVIPIPIMALYRLICCGIKRSSNRAELNPYINGGFEAEVRKNRTQST